MRLFIISTILVVVFTSFAWADTIVPAGPVSGTWELSGSPFIITDNIYIDQTSTLTIEPGVSVLMQPYARFRIEGQLLAVGTETDSIVFTASDTSQGCEGLDFFWTDNNSLDSSKLVTCEISHGMGSPAPDPYMHGGGIYLEHSSRILIQDCYLHDNKTCDFTGANGVLGDPGTPGENAVTGNGGAIFCSYSNCRIINSAIISNQTGNAAGGNGGYGEWEEVWEIWNAYGGDGGDGGSATSGSGGAIYVEYSNLELIGNIFDYNKCGSAYGGNGGNGGNACSWQATGYGGEGGYGGISRVGKGGVIYTLESTFNMENNLFNRNLLSNSIGGDGGDGGQASGMGISHGYGRAGGSAYSGVGILLYSENSNLECSNLTIADNFSSGIVIGGEGGVSGNGGSQAGNGSQIVNSYLINGVGIDITNSIIWDNVEPAIDNMVLINYSCVENGYPGVGNNNEDPLLIVGPNGVFYLSQTAAGQTVQSLCVDAGNPESDIIQGTTRTDHEPDSAIVDMGYHYPLISSLTEPFIGVSSLSFHFEQLFGIEPPVQNLVLNNLGTYSFTYNILNSIEWLNVSPASGGPVPPADTLTLTVSAGSLSYGFYNGNFEIFSPEAMNSPVSINVTYDFGNFLSGSLSGTLPQFIYDVIGPIIVEVEDTLIIEAGAVFRFYENSDFQIEGLLIAEGTETDSICFIPMEGNNQWTGLFFDDESSPDCMLRYCNVSGSDERGITVYSDTGINIEQCKICGNAGGGIKFSNSVATVSNSIISDHDCTSETNHGAGIYIYNSTVELYDCEISDNRATMGGGIFVQQESCSLTLMGCLIKDNYAEYNGGALGCFGNDVISQIYNCTFWGNSSQYSQYGGTIEVLSSNIEFWIENCIIANTITGYGVKIQSPLTALEMEYNCFFNSENGDFGGNGMPPEYGIITTVNTNGDSCDIYNNIFLDPMFVDPAGGDFGFQWGSPCIDAGDPASPLDPDSTIADIGAFYYDQSALAPVIEDLTITVDGDNIVLHWSPFTVATSYNIYRSEEPYFDISGMTPVASVTLPEYIDEGAVSGGGWFYVVTSLVE